MSRTDDRKYMLEAIGLAEKGRGLTRPNPLVGAVIVKNNRVIARDYHRGAGKPHAEILAMRKAKTTHGSTLYVNLEPCCHTGRTAPCTDAILKAGIKKVVFAVTDPDPRVAGKGARILRKNGLEVQSGVARVEAERLNDAYIGYHRMQRPYIILKLAQSVDGRIATSTGDSKWISSLKARKLAHRLRSEVDGVIVGSGTVRADNPQLTVRHLKGINPYRIVVTGNGKLPASCHLLKNNQDQLTIIASTKQATNVGTEKNNRTPIHWSIRPGTDGVDISDLVEQAGQFGMRSLLVEGGAAMITSFLRARLADKLILISAPRIIGDGLNSVGSLSTISITDSVDLESVRYEQIDNDMVMTAYPKWENA